MVYASIFLSICPLAHCVIQFELPDQYPDVVPVITLSSHSSNIDPAHIQQLLQEQVHVYMYGMIIIIINKGTFLELEVNRSSPDELNSEL